MLYINHSQSWVVYLWHCEKTTHYCPNFWTGHVHLEHQRHAPHCDAMDLASLCGTLGRSEDLGDDWGERLAIWKLDHMVLFMGKMLMKLLDSLALATISGFYGNFIFFWGDHLNTTFQGEHDWINHWIHWIKWGTAGRVVSCWRFGTGTFNEQKKKSSENSSHRSHLFV